MMNHTSTHTSAFLNRFRSLWARKRRVELGQVAVSSLLLALLGLGALAIADYSLELDRSVRVVSLAAVLGAVGLFAINSLWRTVRQWSQPTTAAEIEAAFPQLGQSVRTTVQFGAMQIEQVQSEGVATTLVTALAEQTHQLALPLTIEDVVPVKRLALIACGFGAALVVIAGASSFDWEWRSASARAVLDDVPYRHLEVRPGNGTLDEGAGLSIDVALIGRTNREVVLFTRPAGDDDAEWTERKLEETTEVSRQSSKGGGFSAAPNCVVLPPAVLASRPRVAFVAKLDRLTKPVEYRVTAGELVSATYRIDIRRPLRIEEVKIDLTPPSYTGQPTSTSLDANLSVLEGTVARFTITFDKPVKSASIVLAPRKQPRDDDDKNEPEVVPLRSHHAPSDEPNGNTRDLAADVSQATTLGDARLVTRSVTATLTAELTLTEDRNYSIVADAEDGTSLPENKYRIRVRQDQPPQVTIEEPTDAVEVHTLAELLMRIRVRDDYGLSKAGVVFQINNEQEVPLIAQDFETVVAAANEAAATGKVSPTTQAALEKVLPLEVFELTQKDSVMYFAFAEDNRPDRPQRIETDMHFIDIRPFKRTYRVVDPDPGNMMGMNQGLKTLAELIQRQRFALNRTMTIEKGANSGQKPNATTLDELMKFETELAENTRALAERLDSLGFPDTEVYYQAETAMLAAVDSLSVGKWENATLQMRDALKFLIEARNNFEMLIRKNPNPNMLAALRQFDRLQAQKLRRPKTDKEEARELIRRLEELIGTEESVVSGLEEEETRTKSQEPKEEKLEQKSEEKSEVSETKSDK
ncbi:MAG: DUF4175 family protein [Planctomycetaceae bacterium]